MNKKFKTSGLVLLTALSVFGATSCKKGGTSSYVRPDWDVTAKTLTKRSKATSGSYKTEDDAHLDTAYKGAKSTGSAGINLSGITSAEKASILGDVENYGLQNHLLGIPLFSNGAWTLINTRIKLPTNGTYVTNYGFGVQREGLITSNLTAEQEPQEEYRSYYHDALTDGVSKGLSPYDSNNSLSSDLLSYLTGSLYAQRLVKDNSGGYQAKYEWYSSMAASEPEPLNLDTETNTATKWRIKIRNDDSLVFHTLSNQSVNGTALSSFNGKKITAKSFANSLHLMMNGNNKFSYATQYAARFVGGEDYYQNTADKVVLSDADNTEWEKVGIKAVDDTTLEVEFKSTMTKNNVMMNMSLAPVDVDFYKLVTNYGTDSYKSTNYGKSVEGTNLTPKDTLLCSGPYDISTYDAGTGSDREIVFKRYDNFIDRKLENNSNYEVYGIKGYVYRINTAWKGESGLTLMYNEYMNGKLDNASIPTDKKSEWTGDKPGKYVSGNTSTTSLQVNTTSPKRWTEVYGENGSNWENQNDYTFDKTKADAYESKAVMSNSDFVDGLYFAINRIELADSLMVSPSSDWLAEAYVMDVDDNVSYSETAAHKSAIASWSPDTYGYNRTIAQQKFKSAMDQLTNEGKYTRGSASNPTEIKITLQLAAETQKKNWGEKVKNYLEDTFNSINNAEGYKLTIEFAQIPTETSDIYAILASGCYDLCWGGISGGTGDAFGMSGVYVDSWDYGLQMSVGVSTDLDTGENGITYQGYSYSMHAIFLAVEMGSSVVIENGVYVPSKEENN